MEELINKNNQLIKEVVETLPNIQQSIDDTTKKYQYYIGSIKNEVFRIKPNEAYSEAIKRGEGIFDRFDETERRRKIVIEKSQETINQIEIMKNKMSRIIEECNNDEETLSKTRNELIDKIISIEEMIMKDKLFRRTEETDTITSEFNKKKEEWKKQYTDYIERKRRKEIIKQIEEWTERKIGNILFDSSKDNWNKNTSVFGERIMNKQHIIIIIEDSDGNKFGGYVNSKIDEVDDDINDSNSFLFSLESNGRMERMMKFDIKEPRNAFILYNQSHDCLFSFGYGIFVFGLEIVCGWDIRVYKENYKTESHCKQSSFEYKGIRNALCGKEHPKRFTPERIIVIKMK
ncbi:predicted protein [Entamoeba histolytica]